MLGESKESINLLLELLARYSHWIVFFGLLLENVLFIGFLVPGVTVLLVAGFLAYTGQMDFWSAVALGTIGTILGDNFNFALGRFGARRIKRLTSLLDKSPSVNDFFLDYPRRLFIFYHFPGYLRTFFPLLLGTLRFPWRQWLWIELIAAPLFNLTFVGVGWLAAHFTREIANAAQVGNYIIYFFLLLSLLWLAALANRIRNYFKKKTAPKPQPSLL